MHYIFGLAKTEKVYYNSPLVIIIHNYPMTYIKRDITIGSIVHVLNRGVEGRDIFLEDRDRFRFIHDLYAFNDANFSGDIDYIVKKDPFLLDSSVFARPKIRPKIEKKPRKLLVDILAFCLMLNHYHLLLRARDNDGITKFIKRLNMGYAKYFNEKYKRSGALFQGRYKSITITNEAHFVFIPYYIHLNPLDLVTPEWRERKIYNLKKAIQFLETYRWSSHLDYSGKNNFPLVTNRDFLLGFFGSARQYKEGVYEWLKDLDLESIKKQSLE